MTILSILLFVIVWILFIGVIIAGYLSDPDKL